MGINCADMFVCCYERDFRLSLSIEQTEGIIACFNIISMDSDDWLNTDNDRVPYLVKNISLINSA